MRKFCGLVILTFAFTVLTAGASQTIQNFYYCQKTNESTSAVGNQIGATGLMTKSGGGVPAKITLSTGQSQGYEAHPGVGWKVQGWYSIPYDSGFGATRPKNGTLLAGAVKTYTWKADATSGTYILTVFFEPIQYRLTFNWSGVDSLTKKYFDSFKLPSPTRTGYDFSCWKTNSLLSGTTFKAGKSYSYTGKSFGVTNDNQEVKFTPVWNEQSYSIAKGSENCTVTVSPASSALYTDQLAISVTPPSPEPGVTFTPGKLYVYSGTDDSGSVIYQHELASSMTFKMSDNAGGKYYSQVYVKATYVRTENPKHWLTIHPNGGLYNGSPDNQTLTTQLVEGGTSLNQLDVSVNPNGAEFRGYFDAASDGKPVYDKTGKGVTGPYWTADGYFTGTKDLDVWAYWGDPPDSHEVAFEAPAEAGIVRVDYDGHRSEGTNLVLSVIEGSNFVATAVSTNAGYSFSCWTNSLGATTNDNPWTLAVDCVVTNVAVFTGNVYTVTFIALDGTPSSEVRSYTYGKPFGGFPSVTRTGYAVEGWYTGLNGIGERISVDDIMLRTDNGGMYFANWVALPSYTVAFDGNGATSGSTAGQTAYLDTPAILNANGFLKTGYTFANWTNAAGKAFADGATVTNLVAAGGTATLYAVWSNNVYYVDFDGNGATGGAMEPQAFTYDVAAKLSANGFAKTGMGFAGWSVNGGTDVVYTNGEEVVNLCTGAAGDERVMLKAVWDVGDYSRAMHCMTLKWEPEIAPFALGSCWSPKEGADVGYDRSGSCVQVSTQSPHVEHTARYIGETDCLAAEVPSAGTLTFRCFTRTSNSSTELQLLQRMKGETWTPQSSWTLDELASGDWYDLISVNIPQTCEIGFRVIDKRVSKQLVIVQIDQVTWTPAGAEPQQGAPVSATGVSVRDGKFVLSMPGDSGVNYGVWTNADLLMPVESWGFMTNHVGEGASFSFEMPILPELPQLFFSTFKVK